MLDKLEIDILKNNLEDYLNSYHGIDTRSKKGFHCINPNHIDNNPSMHYNDKDNYIHCFSCGASYDLFGAIEVLENLDKKEAFKRAIELYSIKENKMVNPKEEINKEDKIDFKLFRESYLTSMEAQEYLKSRGISEKTAEKFNIGFHRYSNKENQVLSWLIIPTSNNSYVARNTDSTSDFRVKKSGKVHFLNEIALTNDINYCVISEGEFDELSFDEIGVNGVSLGGVSSTKIFENYDKDKSKFYILALDNDEAGKNASKELESYFNKENINYCLFDYKQYKDANEYLVKDRDNFIKDINDLISSLDKIKNEKVEKEKQEYINIYSVGHNIDDFKNYINDSKNLKPYKTGFNTLDYTLSGGLYEGLYTLGAMSSLGKTTFALQIADYISSNMKDVIFFSLEMSKYELMAKSISRTTMKRFSDDFKALSMRQVLRGDLYEKFDEDTNKKIQECFEEYQTFSEHLYIFENESDSLVGVKDIERIVENHIAITGKKPVVFIDYLQILSPYSDKLTDKQNLDLNFMALKKLSRKHRIPIITLSSLNRASYKDEVKMESTKESGIIEYSSDFLFGINFDNVNEKGFDINEAKMKIPREVNLSILKNRNGESGKKIHMLYYPKCNYFKENIYKNYGTSNQNDFFKDDEMVVGKSDNVF